jgi:hypothetical protein
VRPIKRACWIGDEGGAGDGNLMRGAPARRLKFHNRIGASGVMSG